MNVHVSAKYLSAAASRDGISMSQCFWKVFYKNVFSAKAKIEATGRENILVYAFGRKLPFVYCYKVVNRELTGVAQPIN